MEFPELMKDVKGDSTLYAGMLAYVGYPGAVEYVNDCVDVAGQIWRHPEAQYQRQYVNSSSRDMFMGVLLGGDRLTKMTAASYLKFSNGLLCPQASDNRNKIGVMGWAQLGLALQEDATPAIMGWKGYLISKIFKPLLGLVALLEALTVYERYQINLVYCALMLYCKHGAARWWEKQILKVIREVRGQNDVVLNYLEGNLDYLSEEYPHMVNRRNWAVSVNAPIKDWPLDTFDINFPSEVFIAWMAAAVDDLAWANKFYKLLD